MGLAGAAANDVYSAGNLKDPLNPDWDDDPAMQEYLDTVQQYRPDNFDPENAIVAYGYTQAAVFVEALKAAEAPTRLAVMESLHNLDGISDVGLLLPGVSVTTGEDDPYMGESLMLAQYDFIGDGQRNHFVPQGELVDFEGKSELDVPMRDSLSRTLHSSDSGQPPPNRFEPQREQNVFALPSSGWYVVRRDR